jgi:hypothetical protein
MQKLEKQKTVTVQLQKVTADFIEEQEYFKLYIDLDDFVLEAVRQKIFSKALAYPQTT